VRIHGDDAEPLGSDLLNPGMDDATRLVKNVWPSFAVGPAG
jgi:hypothetical protein